MPRRLFGLVSQYAALSAFGATQVPFQLGGNSTACTGINNLGQLACSVTAADGVTTWLYIGSPSFW